MKLMVSLTNRAILLSDDDNVRDNTWQIDFKVDDLSYDERTELAMRLHDDQFVCEGAINEEGGRVPRLDPYGRPILLRLEGTYLYNLTDALERDEDAIRDYLANLPAKQKTT